MMESVKPAHGHDNQPTYRPHTQRVRPTSTSAHCSSNQASVEIATRAADHFTRIYYASYDSETRLDDLPQFYRPSSSLTWNGKAIQGADGLRQLIEKMPPTKHEVQAFDCHPPPGPPIASRTEDRLRAHHPCHCS